MLLTSVQVLQFLLGSQARLRAWITKTTARFPDDAWNVVQTQGFCLGHSKARLRVHRCAASHADAGMLLSRKQRSLVYIQSRCKL